MKKRLAIIGLLLVVVAVGGAVAYWALTPTPGVTVENFRRLHVGMTENRIVAILGTPDHAVSDTGSFHHEVRWARGGVTIEIEMYKALPGMLGQAFDGVCTTADGSKHYLAPHKPTLIERIHSWLVG